MSRSLYAVLLAALAGACYGPHSESTSSSGPGGDTSVGGTSSTGEGTSSTGEGASSTGEDASSTGDDDPSAPADDDRSPTLISFTIDGSEAPPTVTRATLLNLRVDATDDHGIAQIRVLMGAEVVAEHLPPPASTGATLSEAWLAADEALNGAQTLTARVVDSRGQVAYADLPITFDLPPGGSPLWSYTDTDALGPAFAEGVALAPGRALYVTGRRYTSDSLDGNAWITLHKIDPETGEGYLIAKDPKVPAGACSGRALTVDSEGRLIVVGELRDELGHPSLWLRRYSTLDEPEPEFYNFGVDPIDEAGLAVTTDPADAIYVAGFRRRKPGEDEEESEIVLRKYHRDGYLLWRVIHASPGSGPNFGAALTFVDGALWVTGAVAGGKEERRIALLKVTPAGEIEWVHVTAIDAIKEDYGLGIAVAGDGTLLVTGSHRLENTASRFLLARHEPTIGSLLGRRSLGIGAGPESGRALAIDPRGDVVVAGAAVSFDDGPVAWLSKHRTDGQWSDRWEQLSVDVEGAAWSAITLDEVGQIYAAGVRVDDGVERVFVRKHHP
ncbi:MAG: hypothetical protein H6711_05450 [Myxococcales bacterium]|nr:hypothetical protein [Myxococcales bacterium]